MRTVQPDSKQPTYDNLTQKQWVQGVLLCILEEPEVVKRDRMMQYYALLMQDAVELTLPIQEGPCCCITGNWEIEKGKLN